MRLLWKLEDVGMSHQEPHIGWAPRWGGRIRRAVCPPRRHLGEVIQSLNGSSVPLSPEAAPAACPPSLLVIGMAEEGGVGSAFLPSVQSCCAV